MLSTDDRVSFGDCTFAVWKNVYRPAEDSFLFAENLKVAENSVVLDVGTGCGILGIIAAASSARVVATDINPIAVRCAKQNAQTNKVTPRMGFLQADLFAPIARKMKFDLVLFNAPYLPSEPGEDDSWLAKAWAGGVSGRQIIDRFIRGVPQVLRRGARVLLMQSTLSGVQETFERLHVEGLKGRILAKQDLPFFETIMLVEARWEG